MSGIVNELGHGLRDILVRAQAALVVVRMHPVVIVQNVPEAVRLERTEVFHHGNRYIFDTFIMQRQRQVVMIDDVVAVLRPEHDRDHVLAEKLLPLNFALLTPAGLITGSRTDIAGS